MALKSHTHDRSAERSLDPRGWKVYSRVDDERVGKVDDVLTDQSGQARYFSLALEGGNGRRVLLPAGHASTDPAEERVWVGSLTTEDLGAAPAYSGDPSSIDEGYEHRLWSSYEEEHRPESYYHRPEYRGRGWGRGRQEAGGDNLGRVDRLDDVKVASDDPDPRGWKVTGSDGREIGKVDYLLGDTERMRVVYLVVAVDREIFGKDRHVLVPVGHADLDLDGKRVRVDALDRQRLDVLEPYSEEGGPLEREREERLLRTYSESYTGERRYQHPRFRGEGAAERPTEHRGA